ncbi:MAG: hypothetical protein KF830_15940 [Planctomycetes bacterium]|nr:hypothetical protein [Planctomycetota bacterium]
MIVLQPGTYLPFDLSIGVRIVAPGGATITTPPGGGGMPSVYQIQPPAGQQATLVGLTFRNNPLYPPPEPAVSLHIAGNVVFADCLFHNWADWGGLATVCNGDVQFDRCEWNCVWDCMSVVGGRVTANHCRLRAYRNDTYGGWEPTCLVASGGDIRLNFCDLQGSGAGPQSYIGSPAVRLSGTARLAVADSQVLGGSSITWASIAITNGSVHPVLHARSTIQGGTGLLLMVPYYVFGPGPGFDGPSMAAALVGGLGSVGGPRVGAIYEGAAITPWNGIVAMVLSFDRHTAAPVPFAAQPIHFDPATSVVYAWGLPNGYSVFPNTGVFLWQTPVLAPSLFGEQFWLHTLAWDGATFQVGPTFGGLVR